MNQHHTPAMNAFQLCLQRRWIRALVKTLVAMVTLCALFYTWVNWSGARQWHATREMLKAEGETLDFRALAADPVPDADNFCAIPLLKDLAKIEGGSVLKGEPAEKRKRLNVFSKIKLSPKPTKPHGEPMDLKECVESLRKAGLFTASGESANPAQDILGALGTQDGLFEGLAAGLNRNQARLTPALKTRELSGNPFATLLAGSQELLVLGKVTSLRAIAAARAGESAKAHESVQISVKLMQANLNDPFLVCFLMALSQDAWICNSVWELCNDHAGTARDFARLETALAAVDFNQSLLTACRGEMAMGVSTIQFMKRDRSLVAEVIAPRVPGRNVTGAVLVRIIPSGFFDANTAVFADTFFSSIIKPQKENGMMAAYRACESEAFGKIVMRHDRDVLMHPSSWLAGDLISPMSGIAGKTIFQQVVHDQAVIACALERYRIEKGSYPDSLDGVRLLDGRPLPLDIINGKPMGYRKTANGKYALWSVGFDGKDDNGKRGVFDNKSTVRLLSGKDYVGDWVWDYPE